MFSKADWSVPRGVVRNWRYAQCIRRWRRWMLLGLLLVTALSAAWPVQAVDLNPPELANMPGTDALGFVQDEAQLLGFGLAPGEVLVFDAGLAYNVRGCVLVPDRGPAMCEHEKPATRPDECDWDFTTRQNQVRFGEAMFWIQRPDGERVPRIAPDDLLSTYIEEVGHSWQEYFFETDGLGSGPRTRITTWDEYLYWKRGWEYQVKAYILSLDGSVLALSDEERALLIGDVCNPNGYANPVGVHVPTYGPPPGWPNPQGWPTGDVTAEEHQAFCAGL